jgi:hypothetical protein
VHDPRSAHKVKGGGHGQSVHDLKNVDWLDWEGGTKHKVGNVNDLEIRP